MRLLIVTQKVDQNDDLLGFFHRWLEVFSKEFSAITVVCLEKGEYSLPPSVSVHSLGKEKSRALPREVRTLRYIVVFMRHIVRFRREYDAVFVHMNQEYVLMGGILWRLFGKRILLWRNHAHGSLLTDVAGRIAHKVLFTSPSAYVAHFKNAQQMPVGVDTDIFTPRAGEKKDAVIAVGRISPVKRVVEMIAAWEVLAARGKEYALVVVGGPTPADEDYNARVRGKAASLEEKGLVFFEGSLSHKALPSYLASFPLLLNLTPKGSFDKAIFEGFSCEIPAVVANEGLSGILGEDYLVKGNEPKGIADAIERFFGLPLSERRQKGAALRTYVVENHSLQLLARRLREEMKAT